MVSSKEQEEEKAITQLSFIPLRKSRKHRVKFTQYNHSNAKENAESHDDSKKDEVPLEQLAPWNNPDLVYQCGVLGLHEEIEDFYTWIAPTNEGHKTRLDIVDRVKLCVKKIWPNIEIHAFGSFRTGLYLPSSDVDLVLFGSWSVLPLRTLEKALIDQKIPKSESLIVLDSVKVPILKFVDGVSGIPVDISFNMVNSLKSVQLMNIFKKKYPSFPKLLSVLKQILVSRDLATVFTGGLSSYCLSLLLISFYQLHPRTDVNSEKVNLGVLLLEFLQLYGCHFNYDTLAVSVREGGRYLIKQELQTEENICNRWAPVGGLSIEDPFIPGKDIARGTFRVADLKQAWAYGFRQLSGGRKRGGLAKLIKMG